LYAPLPVGEAFLFACSFLRLRMSCTFKSPSKEQMQVANLTFMTSPRYFYTSESVSEGHPDKMCAQISDAVLDAILQHDAHARVACEVATTTGLVVVMGEITTSAYVDSEKLVRETVRN